jgi:hypothetical protein
VSVHFYWGAKCNLAHMWSKTKGSWQIMVADFSTNLCSLANQLGLADMPKLHYWNNKLLNSKHVQVESLNQPTCISKTCSICIKLMLFYFSTLKFIFLQKFQHYHTFLMHVSWFFKHGQVGLKINLVLTVGILTVGILDAWTFKFICSCIFCHM